MTFEEAVERLTKTWVDVLTPKESPTGKFTPVDREPLLDTLQNMVRSSVGHGSGGSSSRSGMLIDPAAFTMVEHLSGSVDAWCLDLGHMAVGDLKARTNQLAGLIESAWQSGVIDDTRHTHLREMVVRWAEQIMSLLEGWRTLELIAPCPECFEEWVSDPMDHSRQHCVQVHFRDGAAWAECKRCTHTWVTLEELRTLGFRVGAQQDGKKIEEMLRTA